MFSVVLWLAAAGLVRSAPLFVYEASPNAGYVLTQPASLAAPWKPLPQKKFYIGNGNQNNFKFVNERQVDSYFHLLRDSPRAPAVAPDLYARTDSPVHQQQSSNADEAAHSPLPRSNHHRDDNPAPAADTPTHDDDLRKLNRDYFRRQHVYEKQSAGRARKPVVEANFHRSERRPPRAQPFQRAPVKDKILHKAGVSELAHARMKEYHKRDTLDKRRSRHRPYTPRSTLYTAADGGSGSNSHRASYAAFYGMSPDPEAPAGAGSVGAGEGDGDAAYYRGNATNFVDILTERKGAKTIGARALDDALQSLLF